MEKHLKISNLSATLYLPDNKPNEVVIGIHGFSGDKESSVLIALAQELTKTNKALLTFDLPCHGENDNTKPLNLRECINSINSVYEYVNENFKNTDISVFATSFGGYLTLAYLSENQKNLHKLILRAPAIYMYKVLTENILPFNGFTAEEITAPVNLGYEKPLLIDKDFITQLNNFSLENTNPTQNNIYILQGKKDNIVSPEDNENFFKKFYPNKHKFFYFENADHRFKKPGELNRIIQLTLEILSE